MGYTPTDRVKSVDGVGIADRSVNTGPFAGAIYQHQPTVTFVPTVALPVAGVTKCFLIEWDMGSLGSPRVAEAREDDNVMDMDICVRRNAT